MRIPLLSCVAAIALAPDAYAGDVLLHVGDSAAATDALGRALPDREVGTFELHTASEWLNDKPVTLTAGALEQCPGAPVAPAVVTDALTKASAAIDDLDFSGAKPFLETAHAGLGCLDAPIDFTVAARVEYLRGVVDHFGGDLAGARAAYLLALTLDPATSWDPAFPPSARTEFDDAKKVSPTNRTSLAVIPRNLPIRIDGRTVTLNGGKVDVLEGSHIVQVGTDHPLTLRITFVGSGAGSLLVPAEVPADASNWAGDPELGSDLARLAAVYAPGVNVYAVSGSDLYAGGPLGFNRVIPPDVGKPPPIGLILVGTGGGLFTAGAVVAGIGLSTGNSEIRNGTDAASYEDWQAAGVKYQQDRKLLGMGRWMALGGVVLAGAGGAFIAVDNAVVMPEFLGDGGGIMISWGGAR